MKSKIFNGKDSVYDFIVKFNKEFPDYKDTELSVIEKLRIYVGKHPDYEFWNYPRYHEAFLTNNREPLLLKWDNWLISTNGNIFKYGKIPKGNTGMIAVSDGVLIKKDIKKTDRKNKYYHKTEHEGQTLMVHRLVASSFIPRPKHLKRIPHKLLTVNHLDGNKKNPTALNLEWCTAKENVEHALQEGLTPISYFKGTLVYDHEKWSAGFEIYGTSRALYERGFPYEISSSAAIGGVRYKFKWEKINKPLGWPDLIVPDDLDVRKLDFGRTVVGTLTINIGDFPAGFKFKVKMKKLLPYGFKDGMIRRVCLNLRSRAYLCNWDFYTSGDFDCPSPPDELLKELGALSIGAGGRLRKPEFNSLLP